MKIKRTTFKIGALALLFASHASLAGWQLDNKASVVNFVSIKKSAIAEVHHFNSISGLLSDKGESSIDIDLASVETNIGIRNERMQKMLFETNLFPKAKIKGKYDPNRLRKLRPGESFNLTQESQLTLHGEAQTVSTMVRVVKLNDQRVLITSLKPVILNVGDYKLFQGVEKLKQVAGLPSISSAIPITFSLMYQLEKK